MEYLVFKGESYLNSTAAVDKGTMGLIMDGILEMLIHCTSDLEMLD